MSEEEGDETFPEEFEEAGEGQGQMQVNPAPPPANDVPPPEIPEGNEQASPSDNQEHFQTDSQDPSNEQEFQTEYNDEQRLSGEYSEDPTNPQFYNQQQFPDGLFQDPNDPQFYDPQQQFQQYFQDPNDPQFFQQQQSEFYQQDPNEYEQEQFQNEYYQDPNADPNFAHEYADGFGASWDGMNEQQQTMGQEAEEWIFQPQNPEQVWQAPQQMDGQQVEFILDNSRYSNEDEQQYYNFDGQEYYNFGEISQAASQTVLEVVDSAQAFVNECMNIPESPAVEIMDQEAETETVVASALKYWPEEDIEEYVSTAEPQMIRCPSIESCFRTQSGPVVQLYLYPGNKMISKECRLDTHIIQLKMALGRYVKVPPTHLDIRRNKNLIPDDKTLADLGGKPGKKLRFTVEINKRIPGAYELTLPKDRVINEPIPDAQRCVKVEMEDGSVQMLNVTITFATEAKPMLGGYFDQWSKKRYHHAETSIEVEQKEMRPTQTSTGVQAYGTKITNIQTVAEKGQQMEKKNYYVSEDNDCTLISRPYTTFDELTQKRHNAATTIQKYWRRLAAIKERMRREEGLITRVKWAEQLRKGRLEQRKEIMREEIERQENPKRLQDLELLYRAINIWRKEQEDWVSKNRWGAERKAAIATLTEIETDLLLDLERVKNKINVQERENKTQRCFEVMGNPKRWLSEKTKHFITADDGNKVHSRQLQSIYHQLQAKVDKTPEGIQNRCLLLGRLNSMTKKINTKMSQMLTELVARELNFLRTPNCSSALLVGVRRRISSTFFFLCQDPKFNPESKRIQKIPYDSAKLRKDMLQCKGCRRMQHRDEFTVLRGTSVTTRCKTCMNLYRTAILRVDLNLYRHMLKELRREEMAAGVVNSVTFLIDAFDLQFLLDQIWHAQSALSGIDNRYLLRLCRWNKNKPWSPWNCVCLTDEEATAHLQLDNLKDAYTESFFHKVFIKQCTAKTYFEGIAKLMVSLDDRIRDHCKAAEMRAKKTAEMKQKLVKKVKLIAMLA